MLKQTLIRIREISESFGYFYTSWVQILSIANLKTMLNVEIKCFGHGNISSYLFLFVL